MCTSQHTHTHVRTQTAGQPTYVGQLQAWQPVQSQPKSASRTLHEYSACFKWWRWQRWDRSEATPPHTRAKSVLTHNRCVAAHSLTHLQSVLTHNRCVAAHSLTHLQSVSHSLTHLQRYPVVTRFPIARRSADARKVRRRRVGARKRRRAVEDERILARRLAAVPSVPPANFRVVAARQVAEACRGRKEGRKEGGKNTKHQLSSARAD